MAERPLACGKPRVQTLLLHTHKNNSVAQWTAYQTSNLGVAGSSPVGVGSRSLDGAAPSPRRATMVRLVDGVTLSPRRTTPHKIWTDWKLKAPGSTPGSVYRGMDSCKIVWPSG